MSSTTTELLRNAMMEDSNSNTAVNAQMSRVEVNQRALIDKILARYASANAVYRELLQNSNDAEASHAELYFTTSDEHGNQVTNVEYRNNGMTFRPQDWSRLQKIAEGNPDPQKVGAFGVGAYSMFSLAEEPMVRSGKQALCFVWKGDALWTKVVQLEKEDAGGWTTFCLPSRDLYPLPDMVEFGQFLCANLTFTQCLRSITVFVNQEPILKITKTTVQEPSLVTLSSSSSSDSSSSSWWKRLQNASGGTSSEVQMSTSLFQLQPMYESQQQIMVWMPCSVSQLTARYVSAKALTRIPTKLSQRMERVTKKPPPPSVTVQVLLGSTSDEDVTTHSRVSSSKAQQITTSFAPPMGKGSVFIGFRTSQTTGLAAHLAAPLIPTVEREAIDLQDTSLKEYNAQLLQLCGMVLRLTLEHAMMQIGQEYERKWPERQELELKLLKELKDKKEKKNSQPKDGETTSNEDDSTRDQKKKAKSTEEEDSKNNQKRMLSSFANFMVKGATKALTNVVTTVATTVTSIIDRDEEDYLNPPDVLPLSTEERQALLLMQSFCPLPSTPDSQVGMYLALGFTNVLPKRTPPVLTKTRGVIMGENAKLPYMGMEAFISSNGTAAVVRSLVYQTAPEYHDVLCNCTKVSLQDVLQSLDQQILERSEVKPLLQWWNQYSSRVSSSLSEGEEFKRVIQFYETEQKETKEGQQQEKRSIISFSNFIYYTTSKSLLSLPLPDTVLPQELHPHARWLERWFIELPLDVWASFMAQHPCMALALPKDDKLRCQTLQLLHQEWQSKYGADKLQFGRSLCSYLQNIPCIPYDDKDIAKAADKPGTLYVPSAELSAFASSGANFRKVSPKLTNDYGITEPFLVLLGVRQSVSMEFLFQNLTSMEWNQNPKPLMEYLQSQERVLTREDIHKLQTCRYLPARNQEGKLFAPHEVHWPSSDLVEAFSGCCRILSWPETDENPKSALGRFVINTLKCPQYPALSPLLQYVSKAAAGGGETQVRKCLQYVASHLEPNGPYDKSYQSLLRNKQVPKIIPCHQDETLFAPQDNTTKTIVYCSPLDCYGTKSGAQVMGFPVTTISSYQASKFQIATHPEPAALLTQFVTLVSQAKTIPMITNEAKKNIVFSFDKIYSYLSQHTIPPSMLKQTLLTTGLSFIPLLDETTDILQWYRPHEVYFPKRNEENDDSDHDSSSYASLFPTLKEYSPFLATVGVRAEPTTTDLMAKMLEDPSQLLEQVGEDGYISLLQRIAANPPLRMPRTALLTPFLLAHRIEDEKNSSSLMQDDSSSTTTKVVLAKASEIYIVDNSFFGRMFPHVLRAPLGYENLERYYTSLGSNYISKSVQKSFHFPSHSPPQSNTSLTRSIAERLKERQPLLLLDSSTTNNNRANAGRYQPKAHSLLTSLQVQQVSNLQAVYSLQGETFTQNITACLLERNLVLSSSAKLDWFDVGYAIGSLILRRCQLEDAFYLGSLLEAPLEQLRNRGFPVDRILPKEKPKPKVKPKPKPIVPPAGDTAATTHSAAAAAKSPAATPTVVQLPEPTKNGVNNKPNDSPAPPAPPTSSNSSTQQNTDNAPGGVEEILQQMFPDCDESFIAKNLGKNPSIDDVKTLAEQMAEQGYPLKEQIQRQEDAAKSSNKNKKSLSQKIGKALSRGPKKALSGLGPKALSGIRNNITPGMATSNPIAGPPSNTPVEERNKQPSSPALDSESHLNMENMLQQMVQQSTKVNPSGHHSHDHTIQNTPTPNPISEGGCEIIPGQSLHPFPRSTRNGVAVFSTSDQEFLETNFDTVVNDFSTILVHLCSIYQMKQSSICIFYDPRGETIAFNANKALHFNVRFYHALHHSSNPHDRRKCYSYWFTVMAHELAHNLVSGHTKEHGFYTESYVMLYLPKLMEFLEHGNVRK